MMPLSLDEHLMYGTYRKRSKRKLPGDIVDFMLDRDFDNYYPKRRKLRKKFRMFEKKMNKGRI